MSHILTALAPLLVLLAAPPLSAEPRVTLPHEGAVQGPRISLGELAVFDDLSAGRAEHLARLDLGPAAAPGAHVTLAHAALRDALAAAAPDAQLDLPDRVRVHTAYRDIPEAQLRGYVERAVRHRMPWPDDAVRLSGWRLPRDVRVAVPARRVLVHLRPGGGFVGRIAADLEFVDPDAPARPPVRRRASVELDVRVPVVVTAAALRRGQVVAPDDVVLESRDLRRLPRGALRALDQAVGQPLARALPAGVALAGDYLRGAPLVRRGEPIQVSAREHGLVVRLDARALEAGRLGQAIRVENPVTRHRFRAEVTGPGEARLRLPGVGTGP